MEPKPIFAGPIVYREQGAHLRRLEQFNKAKAAYDKAYELNVDDVKTLIGRSRVCIYAVDPLQAYSDAELALKLDPSNMNARNMQARAMYTMSDFERSLVMNYRGVRERIRPSYFKHGISQGNQTIQDCIGKNAGDVMKNFLGLIKQNQSLNVDENEPQRVQRVSRMPQLENKKSLTQLEIRKHKLLSRVLAMKYLGPMAYDKFFLTELSNSTTLKSANAKGSQDLKQIVNEALETLNERQEMLRTQRPYYTVKQAEKTKSKYQTKFKAQLMVKERKTGSRTAELYLKQIYNLYSQNNIGALIAKAERMQLFLDSKTPRTLPNKQMYTDKLYTALGKAYLSQYRLSYVLPDSGNRRRVAYLLGIYRGRPSSYDSVIYNYPHQYNNVDVALDKYMNKLETCENDTMKCWLSYEIARILASQNNYALSKFYAKRCQQEADKSNDVVWWLNACFVLLGGDMLQGNVNEVRTNVQEAYERAKELPHSERIISFLNKCAEMVEERVTTDERKAILRREKQILNVIDESLRVETEVLFRRISMVPRGRRFSVLPGKLAKAEDLSARRKRRQRGLSIVPGPGTVLQPNSVSNIPGFQIFD